MAAKKQYSLEEIRLVSALYAYTQSVRDGRTLTPRLVAITSHAESLRALILTDEHGTLENQTWPNE